MAQPVKILSSRIEPTCSGFALTRSFVSSSVLCSKSNASTQSEQSISSGQTSSNRDQISIVPHPLSRLRLFKLGARSGESDRERALRQQRMELQAWNHQYWSANNAEFNKMKKDFIKHELDIRARENRDELLNNTAQSHEELALFYKRFLDANRQKHIAYNFEWYKRNLSLLWPSFLVKVERLFRR